MQRTWTSPPPDPHVVVLLTTDLRAVALGLSCRVGGLVKSRDDVEPAILAIRSGLVVRSCYTPAELGIGVEDSLAIQLRSVGMDFVAIGNEIGYSGRQVRRRWAQLLSRSGVADNELIGVASVLCRPQQSE